MSFKCYDSLTEPSCSGLLGSATALSSLLSKHEKPFTLARFAIPWLNQGHKLGKMSWPSRGSTPNPAQQAKQGETESKFENTGVRAQQGGDHKVNHRQRLSPKAYPADAPPLRARWFYAVDVSSSGLLLKVLLLKYVIGSQTQTKCTLWVIAGAWTTQKVRLVLRKGLAFHRSSLS